MLKKIIILIVLIILGGISYEYIPNLFSNNDQIIYIDGDKDQYKFSPTDKEGKNFNGESLKIYDITRERLLPNDDDKNKIISEQKNTNINKAKNTVSEEMGVSNYIYLQLGAYKTIEKANLFVENFKKDNSKLVKDLKFYITSDDLNERGIYYRIILGPFKDTKDIYSICIDLKLVNNECLIVKDK